MSETKPTDDARPWGGHTVANGVEATFLWAKAEMAALHARIDALTAPAEPEQAAEPAPTEGAAP